MSEPALTIESTQLCEAQSIAFSWPQVIDATLASNIVQLMRETSASDPIIGFGTNITDAAASKYVAELTEHVRTEKWRLLTVHKGRELIALCTMRRNLNPNNRHIADLAKGMIAQRHRGGFVLCAALDEIANQCNRDNVELITLDVRAETPAHRIWAHFGFETYGTLSDYARVNGESRAGHFMAQKTRDLKRRATASLRTKALQHTDA